MVQFVTMELGSLRRDLKHLTSQEHFIGLHWPLGFCQNLSYWKHVKWSDLQWQNVACFNQFKILIQFWVWTFAIIYESNIAHTKLKYIDLSKREMKPFRQKIHSHVIAYYGKLFTIKTQNVAKCQANRSNVHKTLKVVSVSTDMVISIMWVTTLSLMMNSPWAKVTAKITSFLLWSIIPTFSHVKSQSQFLNAKKP